MVSTRVRWRSVEMLADGRHSLVVAPADGVRGIKAGTERRESRAGSGAEASIGEIPDEDSPWLHQHASGTDAPPAQC